MTNYRPFILVSVGILVGYFLIQIFLAGKHLNNSPEWRSPEQSDTGSTSDSDHRHRPPRPAPFPKTITLLPVASSTNLLNSPDTTVEEDLSLIQSILLEHRRALGANPVGLNDEITAALTGHNAKGAASLPKDHPAISEKGELLDRWQTPYRFHAYSGKLMEIRSAGPDRKFFSSDDVYLRE